MSKPQKSLWKEICEIQRVSPFEESTDQGEEEVWLHRRSGSSPLTSLVSGDSQCFISLPPVSGSIGVMPCSGSSFCCSFSIILVFVLSGIELSDVLGRETHIHLDLGMLYYSKSCNTCVTFDL